MKTQKLGKTGESAVKKFLIRHGYQIIACNLQAYIGSQIGEIDILAFKNNVLYIVEVKSNAGQAPVWDKRELLTHRKYARLNRLAKILYLYIRQKACSLNFPKIEQVIWRSKKESIDIGFMIPQSAKRVKLILASFMMRSGNRCDIEFDPINTSYFEDSRI